ncbi:5-hydroxytryptamine receptor 1B-like [Patiria miniata]|uniref:G-protein coupled receptors family 1 profile domain-containing protein n=1 Tax=Patiria miniata TaxID=46514 RepID=A0A914AQW2_PATMI|nr:5-hydroxytryptamine receptor 1B-like [Patiria miniata]
MTVLGVPGNCLILRVYHAKRRQTTTHIFIMALAWADILACLLSILTAASQVMMLAGTPIPRAVDNAIVYIKAVPLTVSLFITVMIAIDRYDCTCRSLRRVLNQRRAKMAVLCSLVFSVLFSIPFVLGYVYPYNVVIQKTGIATQYLSFVMAVSSVTFCYGNVYWKIRQHVRVGVTESTATKAPPSNSTSETMSAAIVLRTQTVNVADRSLLGESSGGAASSSAPALDAWQPRETADAADTPRRVPPGRQLKGGRSLNANLQRKTTRMLFITSVVFLLTWLPYWIYLAVYMAALSGAQIDPAVFNVFLYLIYTVYVNNVVNPFIYGLANSRFRKDCLDVIRKLKRC